MARPRYAGDGGDPRTASCAGRLEKKGIRGPPLQAREARTVERRSRGLYVAPVTASPPGTTLAQVAGESPRRVLPPDRSRFHELTTQAPADVWVALPEKARSRARLSLLRVVRFSGEALTEGIETRRMEGVDVRVYSRRRLCDCFSTATRSASTSRSRAPRLHPPPSRGAPPRPFARICRVSARHAAYLDAIGVTKRSATSGIRHRPAAQPRRQEQATTTRRCYELSVRAIPLSTWRLRARKRFVLKGRCSCACGPTSPIERRATSTCSVW